MPNTPASFSANNTTGASIIANSYCSKIIIYESNQAGTQDMLVALGAGNVNFNTRPAGERIEIVGVFVPNQVVGTIKAAAGTLTMNQEEQ